MAEAERRHTEGIKEIAARLAAVRAQLDSYRKARR
jgi:hypothetical protein